MTMGTAVDDTTAEKPPIVSVVVVSYNTREMTLACLRSLKAQTDRAV